MSFRMLLCLAAAGWASASFPQSAPLQSFQFEEDGSPDRISKIGGIMLRLLMPSDDAAPSRVRVTVYGPKGEPVLSRSLNSGLMEIEGIPPGEYRLRVEVDGYEPAERQLGRSEFIGPTAYLTIALRPSTSADQPGSGVAPVVRADDLRIPEKTRRLMKKAMQAGDRGKPQKALAHLDQALKLAPQFHQAYNNRGVVHLRLGNYSKAEADFRQALNLSPGNPLALKNLCWVLVAQRRYQEAAESLQRLTSIRPQDAWAHAFLGESLFQLRHYQQSEAPLQRALQLDPQSYLASYRLGALCLSRHDREGALRHWKRFLKTNQGIEDPNIERLVRELERR